MCEILVEPDSCSVVTDDLFITVVMAHVFTFWPSIKHV